MSACNVCGRLCLDPHDEESYPCPRCQFDPCECRECSCGVMLKTEELDDDKCLACLTKEKVSREQRGTK